MNPSIRVKYEHAAREWPALFASKAETLKFSLLLGLLKSMGTIYEIEKSTFWQVGESVALNCGSNFPISMNIWSEDCAQALITDLVRSGIAFDGFAGPESSTNHISQLYSAQTNTKIVYNGQSLFSCTEVIKPEPSIPGFIKQASYDDTELITQWCIAFDAEALPDAPKSSIEKTRAFVENKIKQGHFYIWIDSNNETVTMAAFAGVTETSSRIAAVYTPRIHRKHGYASQLVAAMTQIVLNEKEAAMLYTDKLNTTSNKIYQAIGYKFLGDFAHIRFC